ncbi:polyphosphate kinase 2 [Candidatus Accumulibacter phosphatis]|jgi:polyphosphate kinase 2|uniref:ADP/GDP-polyphosphate phosphotransferase n=1 Tax=Candidatus Accumulibacter contiguus TaxID=2954381 RepID=A0ABX1T4S4_9PROT|nr:polyphosphate kinase 2 [Candidatus Accumulibacter contiguus]
MSEVKTAQEEVEPEATNTEHGTTEQAASPPAAAVKIVAPKAPAKTEAKSVEPKTVAKPVKIKNQKAPRGKAVEPKVVSTPPGKVNLNESAHNTRKPALRTKDYEETLSKLQIELVKLQEWIKFKKLKVVVLFEGRDAAGKGGTIKRITESLSPRVTRVAALPAPTDREQTQWYFQRYVQHLPAGGEMVLFDRSWYNRAGVERVMGFCTEEEYREFLRTCPEFERMLVRSGIILIKYWFSVSNEEQERRFQKRIFHPEKHWKLSPMDLESRARWVEYSKAKDAMFAHTDIKQAPWYVVDGDDKKRARLNVITHLLNMIDYEDLTPEPIVLPPRQDEGGYVRPPISDQTFIPEVY